MAIRKKCSQNKHLH